PTSSRASRLYLTLAYPHNRHLPPFPTRRSSDLSKPTPPPSTMACAPFSTRYDQAPRTLTTSRANPCGRFETRFAPGSTACTPTKDRKSTRLNSSHLGISYAVFCLKKKITKPKPC